MRYPRPRPGARDRLGTSLAGECPESIPASHKLQPRPLGPRQRGRFARPIVFEEFRYKHARAIDYGGFVLFDSKRDYLTQLDHYHAWQRR